MEHITRSILFLKIVLTCEICRAQKIIDAALRVTEIDRLTESFEDAHEHLGKRGIDQRERRAA